jgi:hypothetical protein
VGVAGSRELRDRNEGFSEGEDYTWMAKIIKFYIPSHFRKNGKWISSPERGKIWEDY